MNNFAYFAGCIAVFITISAGFAQEPMDQSEREKSGFNKTADQTTHEFLKDNESAKPSKGIEETENDSPVAGYIADPKIKELLDSAGSDISNSNYVLAAEKLNALLVSQPGNALAYYYLSVANYYMKQYYESLDNIAIAIDLCPNYAVFYYQEGGIYEKIGKDKNAAGSYKKALEIDPNYYPAYVNLGNIYYVTGSYKSAAELYKRALTLNPKDSETLYNLANTYHATADYENAVYYFKKALAENDSDPAIYNNLGITYRQMGKIDLAIEQFHKALLFKKDYSLSAYNLGDSLRIKNRLQEAIEFLKQAIKENPNHQYAYTSLGICYEELGNLDDAIKCYEKALEVAPKSATAPEAQARLKNISAKTKDKK